MQDSRVLIIADFQQVNGLTTVTKWVEKTINLTNPQISKIDTAVAEGRKSYVFLRLISYLKPLIRVLFIDHKTIIYMPLHHGLTLIAQALIVRIATRRKIRVILHHHSFLPISQPKTITNFFSHGFIFKKCEHIFLTDKMKIEYLAVWGKPKKSWIVYNEAAAYDRLENFQPVNDKNRNKVILSHASNLTVEKGSLFTLELFNQMLRKFENVNCVLLGPTKNEAISDRIQKLILDFPGRFSYSTFYDTTMLIEELNKSDIFIFPSTYVNEASPLVVLEAQFLGNVVLANDIGAISEIVLSPGKTVSLHQFQNSLEELINQFFRQIKSQTLASNSFNILLDRSMQANMSINKIFSGGD